MKEVDLIEVLAKIHGTSPFESDAEVVQLSVARSRALGRYHGMSAMNPIWIAALQRGGDDREG